MINALPILNQSSSTFRDDADLYFATDLPQFSIELENGWSEMNASTILAQQEAQFAINQVTLTQNEATLAIQQAQAAALSAGSVGAIAWVSGTTYAIGVSRYSPLNSQVYRRIIAGAGTTDPSLDTINWSVVNSLPNQNIVLPTNNLPQVRPSLSLDFANAQTVDPRVTFTRASTATRTNNKGLIEVVPAGNPRIDYDPISLACRGLLIEEQRTNLLTYSEAFDNAAWGKTQITIALNTETAPDGTLTAKKIVESTTANVYHFLNQVITKTAAPIQYTGSIYVKDAGRQLELIFSENAGASGAVVRVNLLTGVISSPAAVFGSMTSASATLTNVGGGWYRITLTATTGSFSLVSLQLVPHNGTNNTYSGDGVSGLFIWGAQLEAGAFPTSYQPSTETFTGRTSIGTYYGSNGLLQTALSGVARLNYNPMNLTVAPKLLLEGASTNLRSYSEDFSNAVWTKVNATITTNALTAPDGALTADLNTAISTGNAGVYSPLSISINTVYTLSVFFKANTAPFLNISFSDNIDSGCNAWVNTSTFATNSSPFGGWTFLGMTVTPIGNGWYRASLTCLSNGTDTSTNVYANHSNVSNANTVTAGQSLYIWGVQVEASAFPTSYIPTVASSVPRSADTSTSAANPRLADVTSMTGNNFSSWYRQDEGTFVVEWMQNLTTSISDNFGVFRVTGTAGGLPIIATRIGYAGFRRIRSYAQDIGSVFEYATEGDQETSVSGKYTLAYKAVNDFATCSKGETPLLDNSGNISDFSINTLQLGIGATLLNGHIRSLSYYPERLSNAELQALSRQ